MKLIFWTEYIVPDTDNKFNRLNQIQIWYAVSVEKSNLELWLLLKSLYNWLHKTLNPSSQELYICHRKLMQRKLAFSVTYSQIYLCILITTHQKLPKSQFLDKEFILHCMQVL